MKLRSSQYRLVLLGLPALTAAVATVVDVGSYNNAVVREDNYIPSATIGGQLSGLKPTSLAAIGTKDAPVDGNDGKPHAGPFVDRLKPEPTLAALENELAVPASKATLKGAPEDITYHEGQKIPETNDGVMDDAERSLPKQGTTGTEGGVSQKERDRKAAEGLTGLKVEKTPEPPKQAPPLPHSEEKLVKAVTKADSKVAPDGSELGVEADSQKHSDEVPEFPTTTSHLSDSKKEDTEYLDTAPKTSTPVHDINEEDGLIQPMHSYLLSLTMILVSEIGDKTFLIAALMAMKHDRAIVFSAALSALVAMTVLSAVLGHAVPALLSKRFTGFLAGILFLIFGARMMKEGIAMDSNEGVGAEMQEVELELEEKEEELRQQGHRRNSSISPYALEMGLGRGTRKSRSKSRIPSPPRSPSSSRGSSPSRGSSIKGAIAGFSNLLSLLLSPAWVQTFVMTFLGEWGDRSQIATIAMAAGSDYWWVTAGAISGHAVCTGIAVIGGRAIAGRVSLRMVTLGGAIAFLVFGVVYLLETMYSG